MRVFKWKPESDTRSHQEHGREAVRLGYIGLSVGVVTCRVRRACLVGVDSMGRTRASRTDMHRHLDRHYCSSNIFALSQDGGKMNQNMAGSLPPPVSNFVERMTSFHWPPATGQFEFLVRYDVCQMPGLLKVKLFVLRACQLWTGPSPPWWRYHQLTNPPYTRLVFSIT